MEKEKIIVLDFGGQYKQLIARRVRECNVYCEILPYTVKPAEILAMKPKGIILTGGPNSVYAEDSPTCDRALFGLGIPVLGICYGSQLMAHKLGGSVETAPVSEYGHTEMELLYTGDGKEPASELFKGLSPDTSCWMSHTDYIARIPFGFRITAHTANCPAAAMENRGRSLYAVQFHPEVVHTPQGGAMLRHFVFDICGCSGSWKMSSYVETTVKELRERSEAVRFCSGCRAASIFLWRQPCFPKLSGSS